MPNYLSKEEIRQWRSSLEKITLEEFAARLGKSVEESKSTNDVVDIVMSKGTTANTSTEFSDSFSAIAERAFKRERQLSHTPFSVSKKDMVEQEPVVDKNTQDEMKQVLNKVLKKSDNEKTTNLKKSVLDNAAKLSTSSADIEIILKKSLTDREQLVFEYFLNNIGKTVYAKELAELLDLPRDYVYKYIKNLRAKIEGNKLRNVPSGGFILTE